MTAFAYGTTYFSAVIFIGYAGNFGKQFGLASIWIGMGCSPLIGTICMAASLLVTTVVSLCTRPPEAEILHRAFDAPLENEIK